MTRAALLKQGSAIRHARFGTLHFHDRLAEAMLETALRQIALGSYAQLPEAYPVRESPSGDIAFRASISPILPDAAASLSMLAVLRAQSAAAILCLRPVERPASLPQDYLAGRFALTPAEISVCLALHQGLTLAGYASARGISVETARVQLKSAFAKTGTSRQAELVALLASLSPARLQ